MPGKWQAFEAEVDGRLDADRPLDAQNFDAVAIDIFRRSAAGETHESMKKSCPGYKEAIDAAMSEAEVVTLPGLTYLAYENKIAVPAPLSPMEQRKSAQLRRDRLTPLQAIVLKAVCADVYQGHIPRILRDMAPDTPYITTKVLRGKMTAADLPRLVGKAFAHGLFAPR